MNAPAGWYQDPERPSGFLRYWDGSAWTQHIAGGAPVPPASPPSARSGDAARVWSAAPGVVAPRRPSGRRHPLLGVVAAFVVLGLVLSAFSDDEPDPEQASDRQSSERETSASGRAAKGERHWAGTAPAGKARSGSDAPTGAERRTGGAGGEAAEAAGRAPKPRPASPTFLVTRVIDGDTVELGNGETVRLVGIDTPEVGECAYDGAAAALERIVLGERVRLTVSDEDRDSYGRLLRYVDVGGTDAGLRLIKRGLAIARYDSRDGYGFHPRQPVYVAHDRGAADVCAMAPGRPAPEPSPEPAAKPRPLRGGGSGGASCAAGYRPCVPPGPGDLDCPDVYGPIRVTGPDPHDLDADGDGVACES